MVDEVGYDIRLATTADTPRIRTSVRRTLANPEGKAHRKQFDEPIDRGELLILEHRSASGEADLLGYIEWRSKVDGGVTIRDVGSAGDEPQPAIIRRLIREVLNFVSAFPGEVHLKARTDLEPWSSIIAETPGFEVEEREFSRGHWWNIWVWNGNPERRARGGQPGRRR